jgi:hypothetical protein
VRAGLIPHEIGGVFHLQDFHRLGSDPWPVRRSFFSSGRAALYALCRRWIETHSHARLWLPDYFCSEVVSSLCSWNIPVAFYADDPQRTGPGLSDLRVSAGDMVLAVNYFGVRLGDQWNAWRESTPSVALIEDHTHDPQSLWAQSSTADFAFASLRKTLPVPDGAIMWSPRDLPLPEAAPDCVTFASSLKLAAMLYKRRYLDYGETRPELKAAFLRLQQRSEKEFSELNNGAMSAWSLDLVCQGIPTAWRRRRERNVRSLLMRAPRVPGGEPLFTSWPVGHCPFNAVYVFDDERAREVTRKRLISSQVYTPVHWLLRYGGKASVDLSKRILTIPLDFRCDESGIARIAAILTESQPVQSADASPCTLIS